MKSSQEPRTGQKTSEQLMPPRGRAPGLKRGRHNLPYWMASNVARDHKGYPDPCIPLPPDASDDELAKLCQDHTARLRAHIAQVEADTAEPLQTRTRYDGSVKAACRIYQEHPLSRFHHVKHNTKQSYLKYLKLLELEVGKRLIKNVTVLDVQNWYDQWRKGAILIDRDGNETVGPERIDRAHDGVSMFRTVIYFMAALRHADCKVLAGEIKHIKFERGGARSEELTYAQASAFIKTALSFGQKGLLPGDRAFYLALGVAAQFELMLRQMDIIGEWAPTKSLRKLPQGMATLVVDEDTWSGFFTWENVPGWRWRMKTSKSKYRAAADFDLSRYDLLFPLLEAVDPSQRTGSIIKGEHGLPVRYRTFSKDFRKVARAAGIPDTVWSMDARAGGATEAEEAGAAIEAIQDALTHSKKHTTLRYIRKRSKRIADVAEARKEFRNVADQKD